MITGDVVTKTELERNEALARAIVSAFGELITQRTQDLPHRFKAPPLFGEAMQAAWQDYGTDQYYQTQIGYGTMPIILRMTHRAHRRVLEMEFDDANGTRLFTLEIEYAIPTPREVLLPSWPQIYKTPDHRNTPRKEATKASSFLSESPGPNWRKISLRLGAELILSIRNLSRLRYWEFRDQARRIGSVKLCKSE